MSWFVVPFLFFIVYLDFSPSIVHSPLSTGSPSYPSSRNQIVFECGNPLSKWNLWLGEVVTHVCKCMQALTHQAIKIDEETIALGC